ncbi:LytR/AlgR family response regulator transcription factor [Elizabethkingia anophelis]|uniref:LytR/AlgR family response regulator transcription factor n=1 Tax=Elizabethkingia anophelis TaxID=1117645 RepID=UPI0004E313C0|nr:LytTR family DNA-binding domain-containing protein [Elizabethkingia anophelis]KFC34268.1 LytTR family transcriptional regulator [Elizabethkingia anophelis]MCT3786440.1 response regulator transcription factor [Elizabethkingia anophelis]MCT3897997.1 response regulator transcription factor [Elizabethkingia anophelis]MCT4122222.1 response regulator transcription factor [Elizabethkingia anophelis]MCT4324214.1 response regulator transcription factor [Elizabethkingia anophelis]
MEKLNCIIIDDEPLGREVIESFVQGIPFLSLIKSYGDPTEALLYLQNNTVDIVFSDIKMPKINGMELVKSLSNPPVIIFITAHRDFALDGFDTGATDYLVKPVRFDRFLKAVNRAKDYIALKQIPSIQQVNTDRIFIKSEGKLVKILLDEILYVEAQGDYLKIVIDSATYTTQATLKSMEEILISPDFFRVQRSFILNTEAIRSVNANMVELINGKTISIALNKKDELFSLLGIK